MSFQRQSFYFLFPLLILGVFIGGIIDSTLNIDFFGVLPRLDAVFILFWGLTLLAIFRNFEFFVFWYSPPVFLGGMLGLTNFVEVHFSKWI